MDGRRRLAQLLRQLGEEIVLADAGDPVFAGIAQELEPLYARLREYPRRLREELMQHDLETRQKENYTDFSPTTGLSNPVAPPISLRLEGDRAIAEVTYSDAFEGYPGHVHGGFVATHFDELFGFANSRMGQPGMTGTLTVRYCNPVRLHVPLRYEGGVVSQEGRKIFLEARLHTGDTLLAEAQAIFIGLDEDAFHSISRGAFQGRDLRREL